MLRSCLLVASVVLAGWTSSANSADWNWPRWRGPNQDGHTTEKGLPQKWSDASITWAAPLKGIGQSSPVIWGERIFLTEARKEGQERVVMCFNRNDGRLIWERVAWTGDDVEKLHKMNTHASSTCVTDGKHVYAFFGRGGGLFCYTVGGTLKWSKSLGKFPGPWGTAACPVLYKDLVIQNCDADEVAFIAAFNKDTGKQIWKTKRPSVRGWSTPILITVKGREELVMNGHTGRESV